MNRQPYCLPPAWWAPKLTPWFVKLSRGYRRRQLFRGQQVVGVDADGLEHVREAVRQGHGVLITPNHSTHYDSAALYLALDTIRQPVYFMTAWQVFAMSTGWERWAMQHLGCFSIDRESSDRQSFKQAVEILKQSPQPLVIFPEGDIYHVNDRVFPFREGAAAIALSAARKGERPVSMIPCAIKFWYTTDPTADLLKVMGQMEDRMHLTRKEDRTLADRIHRLAEAVLAVKEIDYLGGTRHGALRDRSRYMVEELLVRMENQHMIGNKSSGVPERVKALRQKIIAELETLKDQDALSEDRQKKLAGDMEDLFFVIQLYSYPGDYLQGSPSIERVAETIDKFEEDVMQRDYPGVRGQRRVEMRFGPPIVVAATPGRDQVTQLTTQMHARVQDLLDGINGSPGDVSTTVVFADAQTQP